MSRGNPRIVVRIPPGQREMLEAEAVARHMTLSDLVRILIHKFVTENEA